MTGTVDPRFNEVAGDRPKEGSLYRKPRYNEFQGKRPKCDFCGNTIVPLSMTYNKPLTESLLSLYHKDY